MNRKFQPVESALRLLRMVRSIPSTPILGVLIAMTLTPACSETPPAHSSPSKTQIAETQPTQDLRELCPEAISELAFLIFKQERIVEVYADKTFLKRFPMTAFSGKLGPKLREGDRQIPEGIYRITFLNPKSSYHLSMKINYPNAFDLEHAKREGRTQPGSDIFIHGKAVTIGCVPVGDSAIEEMFYSVKKHGIAKTRVILAPYDMRTGRQRNLETSDRTWYPGLCDTIDSALREYPIPVQTPTE